jgi:small subunit ribosomal protein S21
MISVPCLIRLDGRLEGWDDFRQWGGVFDLAEIRFQEGETLENALRRFKRKVQQEDIIKEVKKHSFYLKPGERKRVKQALARKRNRKKSRRDFE